MLDFLVLIIFIGIVYLIIKYDKIHYVKRIFQMFFKVLCSALKVGMGARNQFIGSV